MGDICIGTAQFGMTYGIANQIGQPDENQVRRIILRATENGIFFYDTAFSYGETELLLGRAFKDLGLGETVKVITKVSPGFAFTGYGMLKDEIQGHLERLNVPSLWGVLLHRPEIKGDPQEFYNSVSRLKREGLIQNFGLSLYKPEDAVKFIKEPAVDVLQVPFNILDRRLLDHDFFSTARKLQKKVFVRSVYLQGLLLMEDRDLEHKNMGWAIPYLNDARVYALNNGILLKAFAVQSVLKFPEIESLVMGIESESQLAENIRLAKESALPDELVLNWWQSLASYPEKLLNPSMW